MANILIVEDEPRMRRLLEISLGEDGHSVHTAGDAESGLKHLRKESVDLVVDRPEAAGHERPGVPAGRETA